MSGLHHLARSANDNVTGDRLLLISLPDALEALTRLRDRIRVEMALKPLTRDLIDDAVSGRSPLDDDLLPPPEAA